MRIIQHQLAIGTRHATPYYVIRGSIPGDTLVITAGIHGNERASILAAYRLLSNLKQGSLCLRRGTLVLVPIVNRSAYRRGIRGVPDLNRTFPRTKGQKASHSLSAAMFRLAANMKARWYIDLHEANGLSKVNRRFLGQTLIACPGSSEVPAVRRVVRRVNRSIASRRKQFSIRLSTLPGSGRHAAKHVLKAKAITVETCWSLPVATRVRDQSRVIRNLLNEAGML